MDPIPLDVLWLILQHQHCIYQYATVCKAIHVRIIDTKIQLMHILWTEFQTYNHNNALARFKEYHAFICSKSLSYIRDERGTIHNTIPWLDIYRRFCLALESRDCVYAYELSHCLGPAGTTLYTIRYGTMDCLEYFRIRGYHNLFRDHLFNVRLKYELIRCDSINLFGWMNKHFGIPLHFIRKSILHEDIDFIKNLITVYNTDPTLAPDWPLESRQCAYKLAEISDWKIGFVVQDIADYACQHDHVDVLEWLYLLELRWNMYSGWLLAFANKSTRILAWLKNIKFQARQGRYILEPGKCAVKYWYSSIAP